MCLALASVGVARAGVLDLGVDGANLYTIGNFSATGSDVEGATFVGGNMSISGYSVNNSKAAADGYALAVGGNLNFTNGTIANGKTYIGGTLSTNQSGTFKKTTSTSVAPLSFSATSSQVKAESLALAGLAATGTAVYSNSGIQITGSDKSVEVFDIADTSLLNGSYFNLSGLAPAANGVKTTLIFNVSGDGLGFRQSGVGMSALSNYNVLFNFYQSTELTFSSVGVEGSVLAPLATVVGGSGDIDGQVIVGSWNSNVQINAGHNFANVNVAGYTAPVPEPESYAMLLGGLGLLGLVARRKQRQG
jgi:choice-of-anchor A domain-containing protein